MKKIATSFIIIIFITLSIPLLCAAQTSDFDSNNVLIITPSGGTVGSGSAAFPAGNTYGVSNSNGYRVNNGTGTVTTGVLTTTAGSSFSFRLASLAGTSGNGADAGDNVIVAVSMDGGVTFSNELQVNGNNNARWTYTGGTATATGNYDGNNTAITIAPSGGGTLTTEGYSTVTLTGLPSSLNLVIRITLTNNDNNEFWVVDNLILSPPIGKLVQFTATNYTVNENAGTVNATVCASIVNADATAATVEVALTGGTATNGMDISNYATQALTFPANASTDQCITFTVTEDLFTELSETLIFTLQNVTGGASIGSPATATVNITDNDVPLIIITEILYNPCDGAGNFWAQEGDGEFVEIYNNGTTTVDISGWKITDNDGAMSFEFTFPGTAGSATTTMAPGTYIVIARQVLYQALDVNTDNIIDAGNAGAGSKIYNEDATEGASNGGNLANVAGDDVELENAAGVTIDMVVYGNTNPWPTCGDSNDGVSLSLLNPNADNSVATNWYPSLTNGSGAGVSGGGSAGAANSGGACITNVTANATQTACGTANPITTVNVTFTTNYSAVSTYDIYRNGTYLATYNAGSTAASTYTYTSPNLAPVNAGTENFEVRPTGAPANSCYTANDNVTIAGCSMPIELLSFEGKAIDVFIQLKWHTATEINNAYIAVERSKDGVYFVELGRVKGHGTTRLPQVYSFIDEQPLRGINYYRLRQVDADEQIEYHKIIAVAYHEKEANINMQLYPTQVNDILNIVFNETLNEFVMLYVVNLAGRIMQQEQLEAGTENLTIDVNRLPQGMYFLRMQAARTLETLRFMKF
jgi:hypothetical protein